MGYAVPKPSLSLRSLAEKPSEHPSKGSPLVDISEERDGLGLRHDPAHSENHHPPLHDGKQVSTSADQLFGRDVEHLPTNRNHKKRRIQDTRPVHLGSVTPEFVRGDSRAQMPPPPPVSRTRNQVEPPSTFRRNRTMRRGDLRSPSDFEQAALLQQEDPRTRTELKKMDDSVNLPTRSMPLPSSEDWVPVPGQILAKRPIVNSNSPFMQLHPDRQLTSRHFPIDAAPFFFKSRKPNNVLTSQTFQKPQREEPRNGHQDDYFNREDVPSARHMSSSQWRPLLHHQQQQQPFTPSPLKRMLPANMSRHQSVASPFFKRPLEVQQPSRITLPGSISMRGDNSALSRAGFATSSNSFYPLPQSSRHLISKTHRNSQGLFRRQSDIIDPAYHSANTNGGRRYQSLSTRTDAHTSSILPAYVVQGQAGTRSGVSRPAEEWARSKARMFPGTSEVASYRRPARR